MNELLIFAVFIIFLPLLVFLLIRAEIVFRMRMRAIDCIHEKNIRLIRSGDYSSKLIDENWASYSADDYEEMMFDWRKWTFAQFYPSLAGEL